jgi:prepilin-type N-terminal cleavage/methylation domain-containing protein/prepilin-type processing-associated H-X9-DG protein
MSRRRKGFTLIELLVVIAIIGILAAMVFPVFARARESARKAVCLSNVKNIALAYQMYFADNNDMFPPNEHREEVHEYFNTGPGGRTKDPCSNRPRQSNPYLRIPVVLDEYIKNRDVWRCPSAKIQGGATGVIPVQDWFTFMVVNEGSWGTGDHYLKPCSLIWPAGWGGAVTDSILQQQFAIDADAGTMAHKAFVQSIGTVYSSGTKLVAIEDPVNTIVCADAGASTDDFGVETLAYPDICQLGCSNPCCSSADWEIASDPSCCGDSVYRYAPNNGSFIANAELRKQYARHLGGVNIGFADGHASWLNSQQVLVKYVEGDITCPEGLDPWGPTTEDDWSGGYLADEGWLLF